MTNELGRLRNLARGGGTFHQHRLEIVRNFLEADCGPIDLSDFLRDRLFKLVSRQFEIFNFVSKDWELCERLLLPEARRIETALLSLAALFIEANKDSVARLYALNRTISRQLLSETEEELVPGAGDIDPVDTQSLFSIRIDCAVHAAASDVMRDRLEARFQSKSWPRMRLIYPLLHYFVNRPPQSNFDNFLSYMVTGREHETEKLAIKLLLSDEAARTAPLAFKIYVGLMGHAYDACEFILDHVEQVVANGLQPEDDLLAFVARVNAAIPGTRAGRLIITLNKQSVWSGRPDPAVLQSHVPLSEPEAIHYATLLAVAPIKWIEKADADRAYAIMANMRVQQYPDPLQFQRVIAIHSSWFFTDGARLLGAMLRSIYMVDREDRDLEVRDAVRLIQFSGCVTPMVAGAASGMQAVRSLAQLSALGEDPATMETKTSQALASRTVADDRLWIIDLQWKLRQLEEAGRIDDWLHHVRSQTKLRPAFLTGINYKWVDEIVAQRRLRPFHSFDGAYLFLLGVIEAHADPLEWFSIILDHTRTR